MSLPTYQTGTVSVAAGGTVVNGTGTIWSGINVKQGDWIVINNFAAMLVTEVTDEATLKIPPWPGAAQSNVAYVIYQNYVGRVVGVAAAEDVADMLEHLKDQAPIFNVPADETEPDPSYGSDGQWAYQVSTGTWWVKDGGVWVPSSGPGDLFPSDTLPLMDGAAAAGASADYSRGDHVHPTDTTRAPVNSPVFTGDPRAPTPATADNDTSIATTAFVQAVAAILAAAKADLASPTFTGDPKAPTVAGTTDNDTSIATTAFVQAVAALKANIASPTFTGDPKAPTPATSDNDTSIATTAFVQALLAAGAYAPIASPVFTGDPKAPTPTAGDNDTSIATTAFVATAVASVSGAGMQPLPANANFNAAGTPGNYYTVDTGSTNTPPVASMYWYLQVLNYADPTYVLQLATTLNSTSVRRFMRVETAGTWNAWRELAGTDYVDVRGIPKSITVKTSGSGTYTTPAGCRALKVRMVGGGGGGGSVGTGGTGGTTTFGSSFLTCTGGGGGVATNPGAVGTASGGDLNLPGGPPSVGLTSAPCNGGFGGCSPFGGYGGCGTPGGASLPASPNTGSGGGGGGGFGGGNGGAGGSGGGYLEKVIVSPAASYAFAIGVGGSGATADGTHNAGALGASGIIIIEEYF